MIVHKDLLHPKFSSVVFITSVLEHMFQTFFINNYLINFVLNKQDFSLMKSWPILEFKGSIQHVQKVHRTLVTQVDVFLPD